ncbi:uncharacterized protein C8A04DRAFT_27033 [Dichotomopilus funicola]|uniref:Uncharacterized protein n=1 Tax=Dichotomopilus funicola TaxID=1934379 RepID=A0AAN6V5J7_9PEZI|nr:hypothetical protein C8A04DRAFT_27033 [Dichotomopilus funicola]
MQAVPSLVGAGTATAAAAAGLVFGQPPEAEASWPGPVQHRFPTEYDGFRPQSGPRRPSTSAVSNYHPCTSPAEEFPYASFRPQPTIDTARPLTSNPTSPTSPISPTNILRPLTGFSISSPKSRSRRQSLVRPVDLTSQPIAEDGRDSVSSRESWIRRLSSLRPASQHGSQRSSLGPDSSSMTFSHGSGVPMLGQAPSGRSSPNKLVKRATSGHNSGVDHSRRGSISQVLTLRRPATSHQRFATIQQSQTNGVAAEPLSAGAATSLDSYTPSPTSATFPAQAETGGQTRKWTSFFHARRSLTSGRDFSGLPGGSGSYRDIFPKKKLSLTRGNIFRAYLTKPDRIADISPLKDEAETDSGRDVAGQTQGSSLPSHDTSDSVDSTEERSRRRSMSIHFNSASNWITRTGSTRLTRRNTIGTKSGGGRFASSDPEAAPLDQGPPLVKQGLEGIHAPPDVRENPQQAEYESTLAEPARTRKRDSSSSPLPPSSRPSGHAVDLPRLGSASHSRPFQGPINYSQTPSVATHSRGPSGERSVTLAGSDESAPDYVFGDDEDTDFRSDGMYDSFRTGASSGRLRSVETPVESAFEDSPPSTANHNRSKRLSVQEMLGSWDGETKITEEDENADAPSRTVPLTEKPQFVGSRSRKESRSKRDAPRELTLVNREFGRLSFDDDDDDDWARDDENTLSNHLSPPSSTNSRRVSPTLRQTLRNVSGTSSLDSQQDSFSERPRSNIFDWAEPSVHDKSETDLPRPKTVHGKQELDLRGGRAANRKPPGALHVRSQSVPVVVPDLSDGSKPPPKFGTWGLGTKTASEDWDDDFEFEEDEPELCSPGGKDSATSFSMVVPASIQATQPSVRAHSGHIREFSLLVNDLKRLFRHGKDLDILQGPMATKWAEAESIIALASPDEEEEEDFLGPTKPSVELDRSTIDDRFMEGGFDGPLLDQFDDSFDFSEPEMSKTAVIRERHSPRRRSVFSPEDDIFGTWSLNGETSTPARLQTPSRCSSVSRNSTVISTVIEAIKQQQQKSDRIKSPAPKSPDTKLFFDTNSLQELVKRAGQLRDSLSDVVRKAELLTQSPAGTPRRERLSRHQNIDGSPAFTRVFVDPSSTSPPGRLPNSHSTPSILSKGSVDSPRMQMMTVN